MSQRAVIIKSDGCRVVQHRIVVHESEDDIESGADTESISTVESEATFIEGDMQYCLITPSEVTQPISTTIRKWFKSDEPKVLAYPVLCFPVGFRVYAIETSDIPRIVSISFFADKKMIVPSGESRRGKQLMKVTLVVDRGVPRFTDASDVWSTLPYPGNRNTVNQMFAASRAFLCSHNGLGRHYTMFNWRFTQSFNQHLSDHNVPWMIRHSSTHDNHGTIHPDLSVICLHDHKPNNFHDHESNPIEDELLHQHCVILRVPNGYCRIDHWEPFTYDRFQSIMQDSLDQAHMDRLSVVPETEDQEEDKEHKETQEDVDDLINSLLYDDIQDVPLPSLPSDMYDADEIIQSSYVMKEEEEVAPPPPPSPDAKHLPRLSVPDALAAMYPSVPLILCRDRDEILEEGIQALREMKIYMRSFMSNPDDVKWVDDDKTGSSVANMFKLRNCRFGDVMLPETIIRMTLFGFTREVHIVAGDWHCAMHFLISNAFIVISLNRCDVFGVNEMVRLNLEHVFRSVSFCGAFITHKSNRRVYVLKNVNMYVAGYGRVHVRLLEVDIAKCIVNDVGHELHDKELVLGNFDVGSFTVCE